MQNSSQIEKAQITGILKTRGPDGLLPEMKAFVVKHFEEKTASFTYIREILERMGKELIEHLTAVEKISGVPNPLLRSVLAKLEL